jgi:hypothetical protein
MEEVTEEKKGGGKRSRPATIKRMALEVFSIVLGVLLALAVSEWQEDRNNAQKAELALANVRAELQSNLGLLEIIYPNNSRVVEGITSDEDDVSDDEVVIPGVQMRSSAWQTLATTGLGNFIDYDLLLELSQLYAMVDVYKRTAYSFIDANMNVAAIATAMNNEVDNERFSENFLEFFQMLVQIEAALINGHEQAIESIDKN